MNILVESAIKVSLIVSCAIAASMLLRSRSAALRHWVLSMAIASAALAPLLQIAGPSWEVPIALPSVVQRAVHLENLTAGTAAGAGAVGTSEYSASAGVPAGVPAAAGSRRLAGAGLAWLLGTVAVLGSLATGFARLARLASRSERIRQGRWSELAAKISREIDLRRPVTLLQSDHPSLLVTWGFRRPNVILPRSARDWSDERIRVVLLHELAHIQRGDWLTQMAAQCLGAVYWFNPLVWLAARRLRLESEHACDDAVLNGGFEGSEYATHLLELARAAARERGPWVPAPAMARPSSLERRFTAMLSGHRNRGRVTRQARLITVLVTITAASLVAAVGIAQTFSTFSGSVFDATNRVLPGVTLLLTNSQSHAKYEVTTDRSGRFEFVGLPPGSYTWETKLAGFSTLKGTVAVAGRDVRQDLALQVGSLEETISIVGKVGGRQAGESSGGPVRSGAGDVEGARRKVLEQATCQNDPIGGQIRAPRKLSDARPVYPAHLQSAGVDGTVVLDARIGTDGDVLDASVLESAHPDLDAATIEAVRLWQFTPTILNCYPVEVKMKVTARYRIQQ
jgi:TonB family protein